MMHGQKLYVDNYNYKDVLNRTLKDRDNFLDWSDVSLIASKISKNKPLLFLCNDVNETLSFFNYKLIIHGILPCGSKTTIEITDIHPYLDIEYDANLDDKNNLIRLKALFDDENLKKTLKGKALDVDKVEIVEGKKLIGFSENKMKFIRISFNKLFHRTQFINYLQRKKIVSYNNDKSSYYRVVSRTYKILLTSWNVLGRYKLLSSSDYKSKYVFSVSIKDMKAYNESMHENYFNDIDLNLIRKDKMISMSFDIEQYSSDFDLYKPEKVCRIPSGKIKDDVIFNIGMTYQFINEKNSFLNIGLVCKNVNAHEDYLTIVTTDEKTLLLCFAYINSILQPDFIYEFNGSEFDWPSIYDKCTIYNILHELCQYLSIKKLNAYELKEENIRRYYYKTEEYVKISADRPRKKMCNIKLQGYVPFDVRALCMQLNPTESKSSLKFYLMIYNLPGKDDMAIPLLFKHYITSDVEGLTEVVHYCYIDCFRLHELISKVNLIQDRREIGILSYTSMYDAFYRANGCKLRNLIAANALDMKLFYNSIKEEEKEEEKMEGKYPGAYVLNPRKGLVNSSMNIEEFMKYKLDIHDKDLINEVQNVATNNYEAVFKQKDISKVKF